MKYYTYVDAEDGFLITYLCHSKLIPQHITFDAVLNKPKEVKEAGYIVGLEYVFVKEKIEKFFIEIDEETWKNIKVDRL